jgi:hypothetical protein
MFPQPTGARKHIFIANRCTQSGDWRPVHRRKQKDRPKAVSLALINAGGSCHAKCGSLVAATIGREANASKAQDHCPCRSAVVTALTGGFSFDFAGF